MNREIKYSLEIIASKKAQKKVELKHSKEKIQNLSHNLFAPPETKNKMELIMHNFNSGMAAYDGIMTGIKIYKRIKSIFTKNNKIK